MALRTFIALALYIATYVHIPQLFLIVVIERLFQEIEISNGKNETFRIWKKVTTDFFFLRGGDEEKTFCYLYGIDRFSGRSVGLKSRLESSPERSRLTEARRKSGDEQKKRQRWSGNHPKKGKKKSIVTKQIFGLCSSLTHLDEDDERPFKRFAGLLSLLFPAFKFSSIYRMTPEGKLTSRRRRKNLDKPGGKIRSEEKPKKKFFSAQIRWREEKSLFGLLSFMLSWVSRVESIVFDFFLSWVRGEETFFYLLHNGWLAW